MPQIKKIDYRQFSKTVSQQAGSSDASTEPSDEEKVSLFSSLVNQWSLMDRKIKIEILIFIAILFVLVSVGVFYIFQRSPEPPDIEMGNQFVPGLDD